MVNNVITANAEGMSICRPQHAPNSCAMEIDGERVLVDINRFDGRGRAVVIQHDGVMRIQTVEPDPYNLRTFGARSALGERFMGPHGNICRNTVAIVGMVIEPEIFQGTTIEGRVA